MCILNRYVNTGIDFTISLNEWPVRFIEADGSKTELVTRFILYFWLKYVSLMKGAPLPGSAVSQRVLKYLLVHDNLVVKSWRNRIYYYSSGSTFAELSDELKVWMHEHGEPASDTETEDEDEEDDYDGPTAAKLLKKLDDHDDLHARVDDDCRGGSNHDDHDFDPTFSKIRTAVSLRHM